MKKRGSESQRYEELMNITSSYIKRLHEEECRSKSLLKRLNEAEIELERLRDSLDSSRVWYSVRWERLKNLLKETEYGNAAHSIMANGTADPFEPPTYEQQLNTLKYKLEETEKNLRAKEELLKELICQDGKIH